MNSPNTSRALAAELLGTAFLVATVVGSGIMAERLAGGNQALALLCNTLPTGAILVVLVSVFAPVSGAHFNRWQRISSFNASAAFSVPSWRT